MMQRMNRQSVLVGAAIGALAVALTGCGEASQNSARSSTGTPSTSAPTSASTSIQASPSPTTSSPQATSTPSSSTQVQPLGPCTADDVTLALGKGTGAAGTHYQPLQFTNSSEQPCVIQGYPGVSYVAGQDAHKVGPPAQRTGPGGAPVTLAPGETAHASVGFVQVRNYDKAECQPTQVRSLRVYPPGETASSLVQYSGLGCASDAMPGDQLTVKAVTPGPGGRSN